MASLRKKGSSNTGAAVSLVKSPSEKPSHTIVHALTGEEFSDAEDIALIKVMNPMYISLGIFGLLWNSKHNMFQKKHCIVDLCTIHCLIVLVTTWLNVIRYFAAYGTKESYGSELFRKLCYHMTYMLFACGITANVYFKQRHIPNFVKLWENYKINHGGVPFAVMKKYLVFRLVGLNALMFIGSGSLHIYAMVNDIDFLNEILFPLMERFDVSRPRWVVYVVEIWFVYIGFSWFQSFVFCICINKNLREEFVDLRTHFSIAATEIKQETFLRKDHHPKYKAQYSPLTEHKNRTEHFRQRFLELCKLVSTFDDVVSSYLLLLYLFALPLIVVSIYLIWGVDTQGSQTTRMELLSALLSLCFYIIVVISITISASKLSSSVSAVSSVVDSVNTISH